MNRLKPKTTNSGDEIVADIRPVSLVIFSRRGTHKSMLQIRLIDAIGPFFRDYHKRRINWSKIVFSHLQTSGIEAEEQWLHICQESANFAQHARHLGYNAVTLDDLAHLTTHPWIEPEINERNEELQERFKDIFAIHRHAGLDVYLTSDVLCTTDAIMQRLGHDSEALDAFYADLVDRAFTDMPELEGLILRLGESDGLDVDDPIRSHLHLRTPRETRLFLRTVLPVFEKHGKKLILRTWTVGAHRIGDLIWHSGRLSETFEGLDSPALIVSMKQGESDFFRYLPLNPAFAQLSQAKIIEFQARREYEGAGEFPSYIGWQCERMARELAGISNLIGLSVWAQTGGWHRFRRRPFVTPDLLPEDIWVYLNSAAPIDIFHHQQSVHQSIGKHLDPERVAPTLELLRHCETAVQSLYYISPFARQKLFFRRVRIPPLLHIYWDCLFITASVRKLTRFFVHDHQAALDEGESVLPLFPRMETLAREADLPEDDIRFMRDTFQLIALARRYYFLPYDPELVAEIQQAKKDYKAAWPRSRRQRYRVKTEFAPFKLKRRTLRWTTQILLRKKRGYRVIDHLFTLNLLSLIYRLFRNRYHKALPKFVRKSAMGIDSVFK